MRPSAAFGKPFTYLAVAPPANESQSPVPAVVATPPAPPVRGVTKRKPPVPPPRGEQTRLTTVQPAIKSETTASVPTTPVTPAPQVPHTPVLISAIATTPTLTTPASPIPSPIVVPTPTSKAHTPSEPEEDLSASALISKFENSCAVTSAVAAAATIITRQSSQDHRPSEVDSGTSTLAESTDDDDDANGDVNEEDDGAADIWIRTIDSPVKNVQNPQKVRHHSDSAIKTLPRGPSPLVEKRGSLPSDPAKEGNAVTENKSSPLLPTKDQVRSSFRSSSRCSSPALLALTSQQQQPLKRISAAEALGVIAKPCPRIIPSAMDACRRQSLGNLSESKFGGTMASRASWAQPSGVQTDVESTQSEPSFDYRRKKFTKRCSSADGRNPVHHHHHHHHYHTLSSRVTAARDPDFGAKRAFIQEKLSGGQPNTSCTLPRPPLATQNGGDCRSAGRSSCNCGQHQATSRPILMSKRTVSAEELLPPSEIDEFNTSPPVNAAGRGSFGRPQRVTFALDQQLLTSKPTGCAPLLTKKPFKSNLKMKDPVFTTSVDLIDANVNTRLPPQHPHPYGLAYRLPVVTADVLQNKGNSGVMKTLHKPKQSSYGGSPSPDLMLKEGNLRRSRPQTSVHDGCSTLNGGLGRHTSSTSSALSDTSPDTDNTLVYRDGILLSGPLPSLIQHLVPTADYYPDQAYLFAFILSSRLFVKPHELLAKVVAVCQAQQRLGDYVSAAQNPQHKDQLSRFVPRLVQLLAEWTDKFPYDFRDERVMVHVREITHQCVSVEPAVRHQVSAMLQTLLHRLTSLDKYETFLQQTGTDATVSSADILTPTDAMDVCSSAAILGQQLTLIELERLSFIGPEEFVQAFAKDSPHIDSSFKDMKKTKNLESYVHWFNRLSYLVASEVCKHSKKKQRVKAIEFWIETARECFNIGNFNSLMAIIAGLNMSPVSRLKKTWHKVQQSAKFTILEQYMDPSSNFSSYRSTLKAALWRSAGATDQRQRVVIPFFSLLVKDIYFLNEGCRNRLDSGHINFEKFWQLAKQVTEFITWKQVACPYEKNSKLVLFLLTTPVLNEKALTMLSFEREPPDNSVEKEHYKTLKTAS
ncbi:uncharacterized protein LOC126843616 isoform X1 [Adelges cooleyi]|uniref:uncharacterized protein LOC126843616 isoform X1 n=1 Tax=Adelges cooleyi TaxID=133065 RepID=UPI002180129B|nr:uncharacterized protein LOC126843616 isoform X1 [Adelges cooleyi]